MTAGPRAAMLADGRRLHLQHGPIDLIIGAAGEAGAVTAAYRRAREGFETVLTDLVEELAVLRAPVAAGVFRAEGPVARRMEVAVESHAAGFITPMAAVAGAVADHMLSVMCQGGSLRRAYVNNGGDIALHLAPGERFKIGIVADPRSGALAGTATIDASDPVRGIATSGRHGRSHSLGIADAVTVLAPSAAAADAAATLIANAVDLPRTPGIDRVPARNLAPDSDLGDRMVTVDVAPLGPDDIDRALSAGLALAESTRSRGLIDAAWLVLQGAVRVAGPDHHLKLQPRAEALNVA